MVELSIIKYLRSLVMKKIVSEFKEFAFKGNVIDLAIGVIIGSAFNAIVTSVVNDVVMPVIGIIIGGKDFSSLAIEVGESKIQYGMLIQNIFNFLIIALILFLFIKAINKVKKKQEIEEEKQEEQEEETVNEELELLKEISSTLKEIKDTK